MRKWIEFNIRHPKSVVAAIIVLSIAATFGLLFVEFDSSTEALMPRHDPAFQMGEKVKNDFADTKTFITVSIEPKKTGENGTDRESMILSSTFFSRLKLMTDELETFKEFNQAAEEKNLQALLAISNAVYTDTPLPTDKNAGEKRENTKDETDLDSQFQEKKIAESTPPQKTDEADLDAEYMKNSAKGTVRTKSMAVAKPEKADEFWTLNNDVSEETLDSADREIQKIRRLNFDKYDSVDLGRIRAALDNKGRMQLDTILAYRELQIDENQKVSRSQMRKILDTWLLIHNYKSAEIIKSMLDPITAEDLVGSKTELKPVGLLKKKNGERLIPQNATEFAEYRRRLMNTESFESSIFSLDASGRIRALGLNIILKPIHDHQQITDILWTVINKYEKNDFDIFIMGNLLFNKFMNEFNQRDLRIFLPLVILVVMLTFYLNFRSARGVALPTLTVLIATLWTMGLHGIFSVKLTLVGAILPPLMIAVGSSYSIHIFNQYMIEKKLHLGHGYKSTLVHSMQHVITTVILAGFTTMVGFATLTVNKVTALRSFGFFSALGTFFAVVISISLIPTVLYLLKPEKSQSNGAQPETTPPSASQNPLIDKVKILVTHVVTAHSGKVLLMALMVLGAASWGVTKMTTNTAPTGYFMDESYVKRASVRIGELFKGDLIMNVVFDSGRKNGVYDPKFLNFVESIRNHLKDQQISDEYNILHTITYSDFLKRMHMAMNEDKKTAYAIPVQESTIRDYMEIFSGEDRDSDGRADAFELTVDRKFQRVNLVLKLGENKYRNFSTEVARKAKAHIESYIRSVETPGKYRWAIVGQPLNFVVLGDLITTGQIQSILLSILIVGFVVFLLFKNLSAGLVALIPISAAVIIIFGSMGFMGIPLDIAQAILSSIAIGIGVDDTIHFLNTLRVRLKAGTEMSAAIAETINEAGLAIIYTSIALVLGFAILMLSSFNPVFNFGVLVSTVMIATTIGALIVLPATIRFFNLRLDHERDWKIFRILNLKAFLGQDN